MVIEFPSLDLSNVYDSTIEGSEIYCTSASAVIATKSFRCTIHSIRSSAPKGVQIRIENLNNAATYTLKVGFDKMLLPEITDPHDLL